MRATLRSTVLSLLALGMLHSTLAAQIGGLGRLAVDLQGATRAPLNLTADQRTKLDAVIAALRAAPNEASPAARERMAAFAQSYFTKRDDAARVNAVVSYIVRAGAVAPIPQRSAAIREIAAQQQRSGDDAALANVELQSMLQKQQQTLTMLSNISKLLHDTAMAVVRKIGG